jgi:hypothetical protein
MLCLKKISVGSPGKRNCKPSKDLCEKNGSTLGVINAVPLHRSVAVAFCKTKNRMCRTITSSISFASHIDLKSGWLGMQVKCR